MAKSYLDSHSSVLANTVAKMLNGSFNKIHVLVERNRKGKHVKINISGDDGVLENHLLQWE